MIETAVIMAAGKGTRFGSMTETKPKGFIEFKGIPMVIRSIENLISAGIKKIIIGTGYHREWYDNLAEKYPQIQTVFSLRFAETNSMETLSRCKNTIGEDDFLLLESDIVYEPKALTSLLEDPHPDIMLVTPVNKFQDQYYIACDDEGNLLKCSTNKKAILSETGNEPIGELVGIHKLLNAFYKNMLATYEYRIKWEEIFQNNSYPEKVGYEYILEDVATWMPLAAGIADQYGNTPEYPSDRISSKLPLYVLVENNLQWYEIDDENDLAFAEHNINII